MLSVTVNRTASGLAATDLVIPDAPSESGLWIEAITRVDGDYRRSYAQSPWVRRVQTGAVLDGGDLGLNLVAEASTSAALESLRGEVSAAFRQFFYELTVAEDGVSTVYECDCSSPRWNDPTSGMTRAHLSRAVLTIPCYPVGA